MDKTQLKEYGQQFVTEAISLYNTYKSDGMDAVSSALDKLIYVKAAIVFIIAYVIAKIVLAIISLITKKCRSSLVRKAISLVIAVLVAYISII